MPRIDFGKLDQDLDDDGFALKLTRDPPEVRALEAKTKAADAAHAIWKDRALFVVLLCGGVIATGLCLWAAFFGKFTPDQQKFAQTALIAIASGAGGYLVGDKKR